MVIIEWALGQPCCNIVPTGHDLYDPRFGCDHNYHNNGGQEAYDECVEYCHTTDDYDCCFWGTCATVPSDVCESLPECDRSGVEGPFPCIGNPFRPPPCPEESFSYYYYYEKFQYYFPPPPPPKPDLECGPDVSDHCCAAQMHWQTCGASR